MTRGANAQTAVDMYEELRRVHRWDAANAWKGIALLLLTCDRWVGEWRPFHGAVVFRETNDFRVRNGSENKTLRQARGLTEYLGKSLVVDDVCESVGLYWKKPEIATLQPHNLLGHAFRSLVSHVLQSYGTTGITYSEEVDPHEEFPGLQFSTRSKNPRIDIVARKGNRTVALISARWRFRHDRVDLVDEALAYAPARRQHADLKFYAVVGEFSASRNEKVLKHCPPASTNPAIAALVHFCPDLLSGGLGENGRMAALKSLEWLIAETGNWK